MAVDFVQPGLVLGAAVVIAIVGIILLAALSGTDILAGIITLIFAVLLGCFGGYALYEANSKKKELCKVIASMEEVFILSEENQLWRGHPSEIDMDKFKLITVERANGIRKPTSSIGALDNSTQSSRMLMRTRLRGVAAKRGAQLPHTSVRRHTRSISSLL